MSFLTPKDTQSALQSRYSQSLHESLQHAPPPLQTQAPPISPSKNLALHIRAQRPPLRRNSNPSSTYTPLQKTRSMTEQTIPEASVWDGLETPVVYLLKLEFEATPSPFITLGADSSQEPTSEKGQEAEEAKGARYTGVFTSLTRANAVAELLVYRSINGREEGKVDNSTTMERLAELVAGERGEVEARAGVRVERKEDGMGCARVRVVQRDVEGMERVARGVVERVGFVVD